MIYWPIRFITSVIFKLFYCFKVHGSENVPKEGPYLICSNHCSFFDPVLICDAVRPRVYWVALKDLYKIFPLSLLLWAARCIPVNGAVKEVVDALKKKRVVGIFIEGRRTYTGQLMSRGRKGPAIIAMRSGVQVVPAWIEGTHIAYPRRALFPKVCPIHIKFGKALTFPIHTEDVIDENTLKSATDSIMQAIASLR